MAGVKFTFGRTSYIVPPLNLECDRLVMLTLPPLYMAFRQEVEALGIARAAGGEVDESAFIRANNALVDAQLEIVALRLSTTARKPSEQDEVGAECFTEVTADRMRAVMTLQQSMDFQAAFSQLTSISGFKPPQGEIKAPAQEGAAPKSSTTSSTKSSSRSRARG
jgi:hypothetical protein